MLASQRALTTLRAASPTGSSAPLLTFTKKTVLFMSSSARAVESDPALGKSPRIKGCLPGWEHSGAARWPLKKKKEKKNTRNLFQRRKFSAFSADSCLLQATSSLQWRQLSFDRKGWRWWCLCLKMNHEEMTACLFHSYRFLFVCFWVYFLI